MSKLIQITEQQKERLRAHAIKAQTISRPTVRYVNGQFIIGSSDGVIDVTGNDFIAATDRCAVVWNYFANGHVEEIERVYVLEGDVPGSARRP